MNYRMEPIEDMKLCDFTVELEVGCGIGRKLALVTDLTQGKVTKSPKSGNLLVKGARTLTLPLDEEPTMVTARETAEVIALALLETGKAKPHRTVLFVCHEGLTAATAHKAPAWQHGFRFVPEVTPESPWLN
jgi:hypothetical protein